MSRISRVWSLTAACAELELLLGRWVRGTAELAGSCCYYHSQDVAHSTVCRRDQRAPGQQTMSGEAAVEAEWNHRPLSTVVGGVWRSKEAQRWQWSICSRLEANGSRVMTSTAQSTWYNSCQGACTMFVGAFEACRSRVPWLIEVLGRFGPDGVYVTIWRDSRQVTAVGGGRWYNS